MNRKTNYLTIIFASISIIILVLDSKTTVSACAEAVDLCIRTVIPSLFPLLFFSIILTGSLQECGIPFLRPLQKLCKMPRNSEALLLNSLIGGYPNGAQCVAYAYESGSISKNSASRMLGFCSNAGPAFIFGIAGSAFSNPQIPWILWIVQIISAIITGSLLPIYDYEEANTSKASAVSFSHALLKAIKAMACICGWILLFRCLCMFCEKWFLWRLPEAIRGLFIGTLELTNGCLYLSNIDNEALRFIICSILLSFGGICVAMQTNAVIGALEIRYYIHGKLLQSISSATLSLIMVMWLYDLPVSKYRYVITLLFLAIFLTLSACLWKKNKISSRFSHKIGV